MLSKNIKTDRDIYLIGDVHGLLYDYNLFVDAHKDDFTIQLGDFGFQQEHVWHLEEIDSTNHMICFGNHDDYSYVVCHHSLGDCAIINDKILSVRGGLSIDKHRRCEGISWWAEEELDNKTQREIMDFAIDHLHEIEVIISHDCPEFIQKQLYHHIYPSSTARFFDHLYETIKPKLWVFGHHHRSITINHEDTVFKCLNELESIKLEV